MRVVRVLLVTVAIVAAIAPVPAPLVERWYSRSFYPHLQQLVTSASSLVPVALLDIAVALVVVAAVLVSVRRWRAGGLLFTLKRGLRSLAVAAALIYLWFLLFWGLNYRRVPLEQKLAYEASRVTREQALQFGRLAVEELNALAPSPRAAWNEDDSLRDALFDVQGELGGAHAVRVAPPKRSLLTWYFKTAAIDGMTDPFFLEIIVNPDILVFERPATLAHEWAHLAGYADESEANFVAWLTCLRGTPTARYSGWLSAYGHVSSVLPRDDRKTLRDALSPAVVADLLAINQRLARANPRVSTAARSVYDSYLRANRIEEGIANYGLVVRLMLGTSFDLNWTPHLRR